MHGRPRFLVVDDEALVIRSLRRTLGTLGEVVAASTVAEALPLAEKGAWTAIFVDLLLPDGSGLDVLARVRARFPFANVMVLTGHHENLAAHDAYAAYVTKPADADRIRRFVHDATSFGERLDRGVAAWARRYGLSEAEADVLRRAAMGQSQRAMAEGRSCSEQTIKKHATNILRLTKEDASLHGAACRLLRELGGEPGSP